MDKSADSVLDEVESTIYQVAQQILKGEGFTYGIPSRSKGNQVYVPELDRIVLKDSKSQRPFASTSTCSRKAVITTRILQLIHELCLKRIHVTKRDLFYTDVKLFEVGIRCWWPHPSTAFVHGAHHMALWLQRRLSSMPSGIDISFPFLTHDLLR